MNPQSIFARAIRSYDGDTGVKTHVKIDAIQNNF
jgi:hypothetical protein